MPSALAVEGRLTASNFLKTLVDNQQLSYKFSVHLDPPHRQRVRVTFSKPTAAMPSPPAVAHLYFHLDDRLQQVLGFTVESETHFHSLADERFNESIVDLVIRRKLALRSQHLVDLSDDFSSTRVPEIMAERSERQRDLNREALEESLLELFQRKDPYNDGRISFPDFKDVVFGLELGAVRRRDREILFAFVELDRNDMVDYGALVGIAADVIDTLQHVVQAEDEKGVADAKVTDTGRVHVSVEMVEWFNTVARRRQYRTIDRLLASLETLRPVTPSIAERKESKDDESASDGKAAEKDAGDSDSQTAGHDGSAVTLEDTIEAAQPPERRELYVTRRQLRSCLETPALLLSKAEINLLVALACATPTGLLPVSQLPELVQHVQTTIFRYQCFCFNDRLERYLLQQFTNFEMSKLEGTAEHLKMKIRQREVKTVVRDMKKLVLSPLQVSRVVSVCEEEPLVVDHAVNYKACVPRMARVLLRDVDGAELETHATLVHRNAGEERLGPGLPGDDQVRRIAMDVFETKDSSRSGVVGLADFHEAMTGEIFPALGVALMDASRVVQELSILGDPLGQGRINYVFFQQLLPPLMTQLVEDDETRRQAFEQRRVDEDRLRADEK
ncbi:hypothetical protein ATCC90586_008112 [Pythium insidiosum]|nr:hypothetical protein ATCC90586_008112 [Pythium insidiosum]